MTERAPVPCPEMQDIRSQIDALDKRLVAILAERQKLIAAAGNVCRAATQCAMRRALKKWCAVLTEAEKSGLAREIAEPVWRQLIESSIAYEYGVFDKR